MSAIEVGWDGVEVQTFTVDIMYSWWISDRQSEGTWKGARPHTGPTEAFDTGGR